MSNSQYTFHFTSEPNLTAPVAEGATEKGGSGMEVEVRTELEVEGEEEDERRVETEDAT